MFFYLNDSDIVNHLSLFIEIIIFPIMMSTPTFFIEFEKLALNFELKVEIFDMFLSFKGQLLNKVICCVFWSLVN